MKLFSRSVVVPLVIPFLLSGCAGSAPGDDSTVVDAGGDPAACSSNDARLSATRRERREAVIYAVAIRGGLEERGKLALSTSRLHVYGRTPKDIGPLAEGGRPLSKPVRSLILKRLTQWSTRRGIEIRFCDPLPESGRWMMLGEVAFDGGVAAVDTAMAGGSLEMLIEKRSKWMVAGIGRAINY